MSEVSAHEVVSLLASQAGAFLALLLAASSLHKLLLGARARQAARDLSGVPASLAPAAVVVVAIAEMAAAIQLLAPGHRAAGAILCAAIYLVYLLLIVRAIGTGRRDIDCGCSFAAAHRPLGWFDIVRNSLLVMLAVFVAVGGEAAMPIPQLLAAAALLALYGALDTLRSVRPMRRGEVL
jgi:Methylamine utilisation protein MauE